MCIRDSLNDNTDSTTASMNATRLITEDKVDVLMGSSLTPPSLAVVEVAGQSRTPLVSLAGGGAIVMPQDGPRKWAFKLSPTELISTGMVFDHMAKRGAKTLATIGIATSYGEGFLKVTENGAAARGVKIVAVEKYNQTDQSVTAQTIKLLGANPDAVYIFSASREAAWIISSASHAVAANSEREPGPCLASKRCTKSIATFFTGLLSGSCSATSTGATVIRPPSRSLPPTRRKSLLATPWVW